MDFSMEQTFLKIVISLAIFAAFVSIFATIEFLVSIFFIKNRRKETFLILLTTNVARFSILFFFKLIAFCISMIFNYDAIYEYSTGIAWWIGFLILPVIKGIFECKFLKSIDVNSNKLGLSCVISNVLTAIVFCFTAMFITV